MAKKIIICTVKINRDGFGCARPCAVCVEWMARYNIEKVIYSETNNYIRIVKYQALITEEQYLTRVQRSQT